MDDFIANVVVDAVTKLKEKAEESKAGAISYRPGTTEEIWEAGQRYLQKHDLVPGQLVRWKKGLRNAKIPGDGEPAVILEVVPGMRSEAGDLGGSHDFEPNEIRVGIINEGRLFAWWLDANRFEPWDGEEE